MVKSISQRTSEQKEQVEKDVKENSRVRAKRKTTYERSRDAQIPDGLKEYFLNDDYSLRLVRWMLGGEEDFSNLSKRERDGYEFVTMDEIPTEFKSAFRQRDTRDRKGLVVVNDLCLMKADVQLVESRNNYYVQEADELYKAADLHTIIKNKGFKDLGTKSSISNREPSFQD